MIRRSVGHPDDVTDLVVAAVVLEDEAGRVLVVRKRGTSRFMLPGGKIEPGEAPADTAVRELEEEVGAHLDPALLVPLGEWTAPAANEAGLLVQGHVFTHPRVDVLAARAEIAEALWLHPRDMAARGDLAPLLVTCVLPILLTPGWLGGSPS